MRQELKQIIEDHGYNANSLAKELGMHRANIYNHLKGVSNLGHNKAQQVADFFHITLEQVYTQDGQS